MNHQKIKEHYLSEFLEKIEQYVSEPGDPIWENVRFRLETEFKLNSNIIKGIIWKSMIFDVLNEAFIENPQSFVKRADWVTKLLTESFIHLEEYYGQNLLEN